MSLVSPLHWAVTVAPSTGFPPSSATLTTALPAYQFPKLLSSMVMPLTCIDGMGVASVVTVRVPLGSDTFPAASLAVTE